MAINHKVLPKSTISRPIKLPAIGKTIKEVPGKIFHGLFGNGRPQL